MEAQHSTPLAAVREGSVEEDASSTSTGSLTIEELEATSQEGGVKEATQDSGEHGGGVSDGVAGAGEGEAGRESARASSSSSQMVHDYLGDRCVFPS